ncbi:hypothetical protein VA596_28415 [Amycolatopsis sp., V23-08]|uniref:Uncharacterized protein n=1 Tax=Amycolatopsis heterodermiae TaxID=3110235 RepID=A0ABU5RCB7_9PSEU|nr:hypothetical protein [Amycolatopsis sp., V23-08]MEA5363485.1 hypothetical protein [Amycolatopsis sp., V23-08]
MRAARITRRGTVVTAMATVIAALIGGLFAAYKVGNDQGAAGVPPMTVTVTTTVSGANPSSAPVPPSGVATSGVPAQVRIPSGSGIDFDAADPRPAKADGPNGDIDLYYDGGLNANRSALYRYSGPESEVTAGCRNAVPPAGTSC